jgi:hypothetical protein
MVNIGLETLVQLTITFVSNLELLVSNLVSFVSNLVLLVSNLELLVTNLVSFVSNLVPLVQLTLTFVLRIKSVHLFKRTDTSVSSSYPKKTACRVVLNTYT